MKGHPDARVWAGYAAGSLPEAEREQAERHLATCGSCLRLYMERLEAGEWAKAASGSLEDCGGRGEAPSGSPAQSDGWTARGGELTARQADELTERIMNEVGAIAADRAKVRRNRRRRQAVVHYVIAVCIMLLLMSAGVFEKLADQPQKWQAEREKGSGQPISAALMKKTSAAIDSFLDQNRDAEEIRVNRK